MSWSVNLLGSWEDLAQLQPLQVPTDNQSDAEEWFEDEEEPELVTDGDARQQFESMLSQFGGVKAGVKRPAEMAQRKPGTNTGLKG